MRPMGAIQVVLRVIVLIITVLLPSCAEKASGDYASEQSKPEVGDCVQIHLSADPETLHPTNYRSNDAGNIAALIFPSLFLIVPEKPTEFAPYLAATPLEVSSDGQYLRAEIRPEVTWQNGKPLTINDIIFTFKAILLPLDDCPHLRSYFDFLDAVISDSLNPNVVRFKLRKPYIQADLAIATQSILPEHLFDPHQTLQGYSFEQLRNLTAEQLKKQDLVAFANQYNQFLENSQAPTASGAGAYHLVEWKQNQYLSLERNQNWWGDALHDSTVQAWPQKIVYQIRTSQVTAIQAVKSGELDVYHGIKARDFIALQQDSSLQKQYHYATPETFNLAYIGFNLRPSRNRKPFFTDVLVRRAFSYLLDIESIIKNINMGFAKRIVSTVDPKHRDYYNDTLRLIPFDPGKAKTLLQEAGWKDQNQDGILEKQINGVKTPFEVEFLISAGNEERKKIALILQDNARKVGVKVNITMVDFSLFQEKLAKHDFDLMYNAISRSAAQLDLFQLWHSSQWKNGGTNFTGFGNAESDALLEKLQAAMSVPVRADLFKRIQAMIYQEQPCIFLTSPINRVVVHRRFRGVKIHSLAPGYSPECFWAPKNLARCQKQKPN